MMTPFTGRLLGRRTIAVLAAYALALQAFLPVMAAVAAPTVGTICATDSRDGPVPVNHGTDESQCPCCVGAMLCAAAALPPPAEPALALKIALTQRAALWPAFSFTERSRPLRGAHPPRGPPVA
jgi:hypothetical protein